MGRERLPISSRKRVPPEAVSKRPILLSLAPVKEPFSCPNSSLSKRLSEIEAMSRPMKTLSDRLDWRCRARATSSFPVPFSPRIRTLASVAATLRTRSRTTRIAGLSPTISPDLWSISERKLPLLGPQLPDFGPRSPERQRHREGAEQLLVLPGLEDEVRGPLAARPHRQVDVAVGRDRYDHCVRVRLAHPLQPAQALFPVHRVLREIHVEEDRVEALLPHGRRGPLRVGEGEDGVALALEQELEREEDVGIVVDDQDSGRIHDAILNPATRTG